MFFNQLSFVEIDFDDEVYVLILLTSLPNNWEPIRVVVSNFVRNVKLNFNNVKVRRIDLSKASASSFALNIESRVMGNDKNSNRNKGKSKLRNRRSILDLGRM